MNVDKLFIVCAQPMPHDMGYLLLSCPRTIACQVDSDMVIIDDGSAVSSATESDLVERLHQIGGPSVSSGGAC